MATGAGTLVLDVAPDLSKLQSQLNAQLSSTAATSSRTFAQKFSAGLATAGARLSSAGRSLTRYFTLPILGAGAAATSLALTYDRAFTQIDATTNVSKDVIAGWRKEVLALSGETARSPEELANALYFLASAGLETDEVMGVLDRSARAAAAGLGETQDIARLTANVLNAYPGQAIDAAKATDILVAAVKAGTADPDEFAGAMGRLLPIASKAEVGFDELAGSLATVSNIGLDVNEGVTAMRGLLQAVTTPTAQSTDALKELGLSADDVRASLADDGLLATLDLLEEKSHGQIDVLQDLIPNVRSLTGFFGLQGQEAAKVDEIFRQVTESTGELDKAFATTARSKSFKFDQAMNRLRIAGVKLGSKLIPIITKDVIPAIEKLVDWWNEATPSTRSFTIKALAAVALAGPFLRLSGALLKVGSGLAKVVPWLLKWAGIGKFPVPPVAGLPTGGVPTGGVPGIPGLPGGVPPLPAPPPPMMPGGVPLGAGGSPKGGGIAAPFNLAIPIGLEDYIGELQTMDHNLENVRGTMEAVNKLMLLNGDRTRYSLAQIEQMAFGTTDLAGSLKGASAAVGDFDRLNARQNRTFDETVAGYEALVGGGHKLTFSLAQNLAEAGDLEGALKLLETRLNPVIRKQGEAADATNDNAGAADKADAAQRRLGGEMVATSRAADAAARKARDYKHDLDKLPGQVKTDVELNSSQAEGAAARLKRLLEGLERTYHANVQVIQGGAAPPGWDGEGATGLYIPRRAGGWVVKAGEGRQDEFLLTRSQLNSIEPRGGDGGGVFTLYLDDGTPLRGYMQRVADGVGRGREDAAKRYERGLNRIGGGK